MVQNFIIHGTSRFSQGDFRQSFLQAYNDSNMGGRPILQLSFGNVTASAASKLGSGHTGDTYLTITPPQGLSSAQEQNIINCVRDAAQDMGNSCVPVR